MKVKRQKKTRKVLQYYKINFNIHAPYKIVCDSEFIQSALLGRIQLKQQLPKVLQLENTLVSHISNTINAQRNNTQHNIVQSINITRCILRGIEQKGNLYGGALHIANTLTFLKCRHTQKYVSESECVHALVQNNNNDRLICGLNDHSIRRDIRVLGHTPVLFIRDNIILIEPPTLRTKTELQHNILKQVNQLRSDELNVLQHVQSDDTTANRAHAKPVKQPVKGPNPLSVKKKKIHITKEQRLALKAQQQQQPQTQLPQPGESSTDPLHTIGSIDPHITTDDNTTIDNTADNNEYNNIIVGKRKRKRLRHREGKKNEENDTAAADVMSQPQHDNVTNQ